MLKKNKLNIDYNNKFDVIFLIYYDFCALTDEEREILLDKVKCALKKGGTFVFDLTTKHMKNEK